MPSEIAEAVRTARLPEAYENAKQALAACESLDELDDWAEKFEAIASYARQARDETLENFARRIKARAFRRRGELLHDYDGRGRRKGKAEGDSGFTRAEAAQAAGLSENRASVAVRIEAIPLPDFEVEIKCTSTSTQRF